MNPIPQAIWLKVADRRKLRSWWAEVMFNLEDEDQAQAIQEAVNEELRAKGVPAMAILAYQTILPLLLEAPAISDFLKTKPQYRDALPEILNRLEAVALAKLEWPTMTPEAIQAFRLLLPETMGPINRLWSPAIRRFVEPPKPEKTPKAPDSSGVNQEDSHSASIWVLDRILRPRPTTPASKQAEAKNKGLDPDVLTLSGEMAMLYVEGGAKTFAQFAGCVKDDKADMWDSMKQYLHAAWQAAGASDPTLDDVARKEAAAIIAELDLNTDQDQLFEAKRDHPITVSDLTDTAKTRLWVKRESLRIYQTEHHYINQKEIARVVAYWTEFCPKMFRELEAEEKGLAAKLASILLLKADQHKMELTGEGMELSEAALIANQVLMLTPEDEDEHEEDPEEDGEDETDSTPLPRTELINHPLNLAASVSLSKMGLASKPNEASLLFLALCCLENEYGEPAVEDDPRKLILAGLLMMSQSLQLAAVRMFESELEPGDVLRMPTGELADLVARQFTPN